MAENGKIETAPEYRIERFQVDGYARDTNRVYKFLGKVQNRQPLPQLLLLTPPFMQLFLAWMHKMFCTPHLEPFEKHNIAGYQLFKASSAEAA